MRANSLSAAIFSTLLTLVPLAIYEWYRSHLCPQLPRATFWPLLGCTYFVLFLPWVARGLGIYARRPIPYSEGTLTLASLVFLIATSYLFSNNIGLFVSTIGYLFFVLGWALWLWRGDTLGKILLGLFAILLGIWLTGAAWCIGYANPFNLERMIVNHYGNVDTLLHPAIAAMIGTYDVPSLGSDGLVKIDYHYGSHWFLAALSKLGSLNLFEFYSFCTPLFILPLLFKAIIDLICQLYYKRNGKLLDLLGRDGMWVFGILLISRVGFLPKSMLFGLGDGWLSDIASESYLLAISFSVLFLDTLLNTLKSLSESSDDIKRDTMTRLALPIVIPFFIFALTLTKITVGSISFGTLVYFFLRFRGYKRPLFLLTLLLAAISFYLGYQTTWKSDSDIFFYAFHFIRECISPQYYPFFPLVGALWSFLFFQWACHRNGVMSVADLRRSWAIGATTEIEFVLIVAFFSLIPGLVYFIPGGSAIYFLDYQKWMAVIFLASMPIKRLEGNALKSFYVLPIVLTFAMAVVWNYQTSIFERRRFFVDEFKGLLMKYPSIGKKEKQTIAQLQELSRLSREEKKRSFVYVPESHSVFWNLGTEGGIPSFSIPFLVPALTGIRMIHGSFHADKNNARARSNYSLESRPFPGVPLTKLCKRVLEDKGSILYVLRLQNNQPLLDRYECRSKGTTGSLFPN